jgi:hypothetical protein
LHRIGGANAGCIRQILGERPHLLARKNLVPRDAKLPEPPDRRDAFRRGELFFPDESGEGAPRFQWRAPPHDHPLQFPTQATALYRGGL